MSSEIKNAKCRKAIAEIVLRFRTEMNLNQRELGVLVFGGNNANDQLVISKLEKANRDLKTCELIKLSKVFKLSPEKLLSLIIEKSR